ncbi:MAG TPA: ABC transporter ATP-binding protein [Sedimentibacter sp.]|nr:ABC transporter ATP-binding protein [Sedimentibacter sp.]HQK53189.1 ABC transporter ATP-binding protein [Sedimentibacter sp.]
MDEKEKILEIKGLKKYFPLRNKKFVKAVDGVDLEIYKGETLGLVGESGSGKSTIAYMVVGMYSATEGKIIFEGEDLTKNGVKRRKKQKGAIQIVFQDPGSSLNPRKRIKKSIDLSLSLHNNIERSKHDDKICELLEMVGLPTEFSEKFPKAIGGGERQLVSVARALAANPSLIILDEPTSALDVSVQAKVIKKLMDLQKEIGLSYLFITHDLSLMRNVAKRVAILYLGKVCELAPTTEFFQKPLHPYTNMLLSSIPVATYEEEAYRPNRIESTGEIPSPVDVPPGCAFHKRCIDCMEICTKEPPRMIEVYPGHQVCCHKYTKPFENMNEV